MGTQETTREVVVVVVVVRTEEAEAPAGVAEEMAVGGTRVWTRSSAPPAIDR